MPLIFDNLCVAVGVVIFGLVGRGAYDIKKEIHRAKLGLLDFDNWPEALVGFLALMLILGIILLLKVAF